jgi:hypothetical protein
LVYNIEVIFKDESIEQPKLKFAAPNAFRLHNNQDTPLARVLFWNSAIKRRAAVGPKSFEWRWGIY